jgi:hypothetical protein
MQRLYPVPFNSNLKLCNSINKQRYDGSVRSLHTATFRLTVVEELHGPEGAHIREIRPVYDWLFCYLASEETYDIYIYLLTVSRLIEINGVVFTKN